MAETKQGQSDDDINAVRAIRHQIIAQRKLGTNKDTFNKEFPKAAEEAIEKFRGDIQPIQTDKEIAKYLKFLSCGREVEKFETFTTMPSPLFACVIRAISNPKAFKVPIARVLVLFGTYFITHPVSNDKMVNLILGDESFFYLELFFGVLALLLEGEELSQADVYFRNLKIFVRNLIVKDADGFLHQSLFSFLSSFFLRVHKKYSGPEFSHVLRFLSNEIDTIVSLNESALTHARLFLPIQFEQPETRSLFLELFSVLQKVIENPSPAGRNSYERSVIMYFKSILTVGKNVLPPGIPPEVQVERPLPNFVFAAMFDVLANVLESVFGKGPNPVVLRYFLDFLKLCQPAVTLPGFDRSVVKVIIGFMCYKIGEYLPQSSNMNVTSLMAITASYLKCMDSEKWVPELRKLKESHPAPIEYHFGFLFR